MEGGNGALLQLLMLRCPCLHLAAQTLRLALVQGRGKLSSPRGKATPMVTMNAQCYIEQLHWDQERRAMPDKRPSGIKTQMKMKERGEIFTFLVFQSMTNSTQLLCHMKHSLSIRFACPFSVPSICAIVRTRKE